MANPVPNRATNPKRVVGASQKPNNSKEAKKTIMAKFYPRERR
jgi:hypothetical protein